ncbi:hypothetical protein A2U01_0118549, partial [Trifolium medium]|nr:hypothetical protein [Trifolium medium]
PATTITITIGITARTNRETPDIRIVTATIKGTISTSEVNAGLTFPIRTNWGRFSGTPLILVQIS